MAEHYTEVDFVKAGKAGIEIRSSAMFDMFEAKLKKLTRMTDLNTKPVARQVSLTGKDSLAPVKRKQPSISRHKRPKLAYQPPLTNYTG